MTLSSNRRKWSREIAFALLGLVAMAGTATAHGSLTMDQDRCVLRLGKMLIHFAGYQPDKERTTEFCEDIPNVGRTVVVLDFVDDQLRDIPIEVRIIRDDGTLDDHGKAAVLNVPAKLYPNGSLTFSHTFDAPGKFVGLVMASTTQSTSSMSMARFPFSVGTAGAKVWTRYAMLAAGLVGIMVLLMSVGLMRRQRMTEDRRA
jgi:hypothetical protein